MASKKTADKKGKVKTTKKRVTTKTVRKTKSPVIAADVQKTNLKTSKKSVNYLIYGSFLALLLSALYLARGFFVAAMVNGKPITRWSLIRELEKSQGKSTLDNLVAKELILQEAKKQNAVVNLEDIKPDLEDIAKQVEADGSTLDAALAERGLTRADFEENYRMQKMLEKILEENLAVSDEELMRYFEENKEYFGEDAKYEDLKENLRLQLKQEKFDFEYEKWYNQAKADSNVIYNLSF